MPSPKYQGPQYITDDLLEVVFHSELDNIRRYSQDQSHLLGAISPSQLGLLHAPFSAIVHSFLTELLEVCNFKDRQESIRKRLVLAVKADIGYVRYNRNVIRISQEIDDFINFVLAFQSAAFEPHPAKKILDHFVAPLYEKVIISDGIQITSPPKELVNMVSTITGLSLFDGPEEIRLVSDNVFVAPLLVEKGRIVHTQIVPSRVARILATMQADHWMFFDRFMARFFNVAFEKDLTGTTLTEICSFALDQELKKHFPEISKSSETPPFLKLTTEGIEISGQPVSFELSSYWRFEPGTENNIDVCEINLSLGKKYNGFRIKLSGNGEYTTAVNKPEFAVMFFTFPELKVQVISSLSQLLNQPTEK